MNLFSYLESVDRVCTCGTEATGKERSAFKKRLLRSFFRLARALVMYATAQSPSRD